MNDHERLVTYLAGWDEGIRCFLDTLSWVPDEQVVFVVRQAQARVERKRKATA